MTISLLGGQWKNPEAMRATLNAFAFEEMPFAIVQTVSKGLKFTERPDFGENGIPVDLLRLHVFGAGGDLMVRRDENMFFWRFVGKSDSAHGLDGASYPDELSLGDVPQQAMLWGRYQGNDEWQEDIVGKAELRYPHPEIDKDEHLLIFAHAVLAKGQAVAYWTYEMAPDKTSKKGE